MIRIRTATVTAVRRRWTGCVQLDVQVDESPPAEAAPGTAGQVTARALAYPQLCGEVGAGDRVLLNTGAVALGLGTGGYHLVIAVLDAPRPAADAAGEIGHPGHLVKARYTPLQAVVLGVDEEASPHRAAMAAAADLGGMPVVIADLHSALPAVLAGIRADRPAARVAYVMTDGGALPAWFSRTVAGLHDELAGTVTAGQAFGGDLEAVTVHSALLACRAVLHADVTIVAQGPGNLGTGTTWGFSGVAAGEAVNAAAVLGGRPVASLRISDADPRPRHRGVSHHSLTAYGRVALAAADVVLPIGMGLLSDGGDDFETGCLHQLDDAGITARHRVVHVGLEGLHASLAASPVPLSTMGRGLDADPAYFLAAAAAGRHAAALLDG